MNLPPLDYVLWLIEHEGRIDEFNAYAANSGVHVIVAAFRFYTEVMEYPAF